MLPLVWHEGGPHSPASQVSSGFPSSRRRFSRARSSPDKNELERRAVGRQALAGDARFRSQERWDHEVPGRIRELSDSVRLTNVGQAHARDLRLPTPVGENTPAPARPARRPPVARTEAAAEAASLAARSRLPWRKASRFPGRRTGRTFRDRAAEIPWP